MSVPLGIVELDEGAGPASPRLAAGDGRWARLGDRLLVWGDQPETMRAAGVAVDDAGEVPSADELQLVTQVGRLFQMDHPDVPVVLDKGRFLVVRLTAGDAARLGGHEQVCYGVAPLQPGMVVFERIQPRARAAEPWVGDLVGAVSRTSYEATLTHLVSFPTRHSLSSQFDAAAGWAQDELGRLGYTTRSEAITVGAGASRNLIAERQGGGPEPRDLVLVTAHLDSVNHPAGGGQDVPAPGADDNGSGAAAVLEMARVLSSHPALHDLRLILFGGEEQGLFGSRQHVAALPAADRTRIRAVINMDMVGSRNSPARTVLLEGAAVSQGLMDSLATAAATYTGLLVQRSLNPFASDHVPFIDASIPAVLTIEGADSANANIHTEGDTLAQIDYDLALEIIRMNVATTAEALGQQPRQDLGAVARSIIDANLYMVLATADPTGQPWVSPVYYAAAGYTELYWVSSPEARHSRCLASRPQVSIVVFDSQVPIGTGQGVYMSAVAEELTGADLAKGIEVFSRGSQGHGGREWTPADVRPPALYRLYRATVSEHWVLDPAGHPDHRTPVTP